MYRIKIKTVAGDINFDKIDKVELDNIINLFECALSSELKGTEKTSSV